MSGKQHPERQNPKSHDGQSCDQLNRGKRRLLVRDLPARPDEDRIAKGEEDRASEHVLQAGGIDEPEAVNCAEYAVNQRPRLANPSGRRVLFFRDQLPKIPVDPIYAGKIITPVIESITFQALFEK